MSGEHDEPPQAALPPALSPSFCGFVAAGFGDFGPGAAVFCGGFSRAPNAEADAAVELDVSPFLFWASPSGEAGSGAPGAAVVVASGVGAGAAEAGGADAPAGSARTAPLLHASIELAVPSVSAASSASYVSVGLRMGSS